MGDKDQEGGVVVFAGGTDWSRLGRSVGKNKKGGKDQQDEEARSEQYPNLVTPHRIKGLLDVRIKFIAAGTTACHCMAVTTEGAVYTWGRNEKGQLGHGDTLQRNNPTIVASISSKSIVAGAAGKHHTLLVTADGEALACGSNQQGQLGLGSIKSHAKFEELVKMPTKSLVEKCTAVACCSETSFWLCDGRLWAAGNPQYGQLGDGSNHEYNAKESSIKLAYEPQATPKLVSALANKVKSVACGQYHAVAVDEEGKCFTWGNGGYGRLGHKVQQDEFTPTEVDTFKGRFALQPDTLIAAGQTTSFAVGVGGQLFAWGKLKYNGDNTMYPKPFDDLSGWNIRSMACGPATFAVAAESSVITWGQATNGELGYGSSGKKSSANPDKCQPLEGLHALQVACGVGFNLFLMRAGEAKLEQLPVFESTVEDAEEAAEEEEEPAGKGAKGAKGAGKAKGKQAAAAAKGTKRAAPAAAKGKAKKAK